jgi:hypothetical protein
MKFDMAHTRPSSIAKHKRKAAATVNSGGHSRNAALQELARRYPDKEEVGYFWKDPRAKTTRTRRWTIRDLDPRAFQTGTLSKNEDLKCLHLCLSEWLIVKATERALIR